MLPTHGLEDGRYAEPDRIVERATQGRIRVTYIHRDGRDVVVSLRTKLGMTFEQCTKMVDWTLDRYAWLQPYAEEARLLAQRYDGLTSDVAGGVREIASFLELDVPAEAVARIAHTCSMDRRRRW